MNIVSVRFIIGNTDSESMQLCVALLLFKGTGLNDVSYLWHCSHF